MIKAAEIVGDSSDLINSVIVGIALFVVVVVAGAVVKWWKNR